MPHATICPDLGQYQALAAGRSSDIERGNLLAHLERCEACAARLNALPEQDALVGLIRQGRTLGDGDTRDTINRLVERLSKLRPESRAGAGSQPGADAVRKPEKTIDHRPPAAEDKELYDFLAPPQAPDELGRLGPYRVLQVLGSGGMGVVFRAEDPQLARPVALKAMLPALAAVASARQRFLREARAAAAIKHDHIVTIYQVGEDRGVPFQAMELLEGESLDARLERAGKLPAAEVIRIGREIALGLAAAHQRGLIHRDVKPANIWLESPGLPGTSTTGGRVKILDFGLARAVGAEAQITHQGAIIGTPSYMAPEQGRGEKVDQRCDLFSLGCVLYRLAVGEPPFRGTDVISTLMAAAAANPTPPVSLDSEVPGELSDFIMQLLAKEPGERPASAQAVAETLERIATVGDANRAAPPIRPAQVDSPLLRMKWPIIAGVAVCFLLAGLAVLLASGVFKVKTADGTLVVQVNEPNPEVFVDGGRVTVSWDEGGKQAEIRVRPGTRKVEVKKDGFTVYGEEVTLEDGKQGPVVLAHLEPLQPKKSEWTVGKGERFASLRDAVLEAPAGARIEVQPGSYKEKPLVLTRDVEIVGVGPRENIHILWDEGTGIASTAKKVVLQGLTLWSGKGSTVEITDGECRLEDCDLSQAGGSPSAPNLMVVRGENTSVHLTRCDLHDAVGNSGVGITAEKCQLFMDHCTLRRTHWQGIFMVHGHGELRFCTVSETGTNIIWFNDYASLDASDCTFSDGRNFSSVVVSGAAKGTLTRCRIINSRDRAFAVSVGGTAMLDDCDVTGNQSGLCANTQEADCRRNGYPILTKITVTNCRVMNNKGPGLTMYEQAEAVVTGCDLTGNAGGAWDIAPACTIKRENNKVDP